VEGEIGWTDAMLRKALGDVLGDAAVIQRCQLYQGRNLDALVPKTRQACVRAILRRAYRAARAPAARPQLTALATWLETNGHADAAASVREGLEGTLTVLEEVDHLLRPRSGWRRARACSFLYSASGTFFTLSVATETVARI
jgi:hypothetical protein